MFNIPIVKIEWKPSKVHNIFVSRFLGSENRDTFFSNVQRSRIVYEILSTAIFGKKKKGEVGIDRLVDEGVFSSAFPLHDVSWKSEDNVKLNFIHNS